MSAIIIDGRVRVTWSAALGNVAAPTVAELNAGTALEQFIQPDGLDVGMDTGGVDTSNLGSTFTTMRAGRKKPSVTIGFHHDGPTDTPYNLLPYRTAGFIIIRRGVDRTTAWTVGDKVEVYPVETGEAVQVKPGPDSTWDFTSPMFVMADPNTRAVVA
jgi:hypothetical protein